MNYTRKTQSIHRITPLLLALALVFSGCAGKRTPLQRTITANAAVAKANRSLVDAVKQLQAANTLNASQARIVMEISLKVAKTSEDIRVLTDSPGDWPAKSAAIVKALNDLNVVALVGPAQTVNPALTTAINAVVAAVKLIQAEVAR